MNVPSAGEGRRIGIVVQKSHFIGQQKIGDGSMMFGGGCEQLGCASEGIRNRSRGHCFRVLLGLELLRGEDEASTDGVEDLLRDEGVVWSEGGEPHPIRMSRLPGIGVHLVAMESQVFGFGEGNCFSIEKVKCSVDRIASNSASMTEDRRCREPRP